MAKKTRRWEERLWKTACILCWYGENDTGPLNYQLIDLWAKFGPKQFLFKIIKINYNNLLLLLCFCFLFVSLKKKKRFDEYWLVVTVVVYHFQNRLWAEAGAGLNVIYSRAWTRSQEVLWASYAIAWSTKHESRYGTTLTTNLSFFVCAFFLLVWIITNDTL